MDFKNLFNFDEIYGKKLLTIAYYALAIIIAIFMTLSILTGIIQIFSAPFTAMLRVMITIPLGVVAFLILRVICEVIAVFFDKNQK